MAHDDQGDHLSGPSSLTLGSTETSTPREVEQLQERVRALQAENVRLRASLGERALTARQAQTGDLHTASADRDILLSAIEKTRMPMILTDPNQPDNPIIFANRAFQELSGYEADELVGRNCRFLQGPDTDRAKVTQVRQAIGGQRDVAVELLNYRRDGTPFVNELYVSPVFDQDGRLLYFFGSQLDITGFRKSQTQLQASEERRRAIFDSAVDFAIVATDRDGRVTDWNIGAEHIFGWSADEMRGETADRLFTPEDRAIDRVAFEMATALSEGRASDERWHLKKDGSRFWASGEMMPIREAIGRHIGFVKIVRDRTRERLADEHSAQIEQALAAVEKRQRLAVEATGIGIFDYHPQTGELIWDERVRVLFGVDPEAPISYDETFLGCLHPEDRADTDAAVRGALDPDGPGTFNIEYRVRPASGGGERWLAAQGQAIVENGVATRFVGSVRDVTIRKEAERQLEATRERYALVGRATKDVIWDWDLVRDHVLWNEALSNAYGYDLAAVEPTGAWWLDHVHPDDRRRVEDDIRGTIAGSESEWSHEYRFRRRDGSHADVLDRGYVVRGPRGEPIRMIGAMLDLTEERTAQDALRRSEERYRMLFDSIDEGFCVLEFVDGPHGPLSDYVHVAANPAYTANAGIPDIVGRKVRDVLPGEAQGWIELFGGVLETGTPIRFERELAATERHLELAAFRIEPADRRQVAVLFQDVTARRRAEAALKQLNQTLELRVAERTADRDRIWRLSLDLLGVADGEGRWISINPAWIRLLGWREEEIVGRTSEWLEHPDDRERTRAEVAHLAAGGKTLAFVNRFQSRDGGYRWLSWTASPEGGLLYCTARDVTAEKEAAEALSRTEDALRQSQKMEAVGQLTGGLAHDFNNLLAGISGSLELMGARLSQGRLGELDRYMAAAQGAAKRAAALTHRLLAFSRRQTLDPKPTDVNRLVGGMEEFVRRSVGPVVEVEVVTAAGLWPTLVDAGQLENALLNLCINARDAMPDGGRITIETANKWLDEWAADERELPPGQYISLCVTDTGTGMTPDVIAKAFDPFFTTKPIGQGTGLGLSMIYGFARQSGGQVRIYSEVGQGTTMCIYLPRHYGVADETEPRPELAHAARAEQGETVLVVDDEPTIRMLVTEVLEELGYVAIEAADAIAGLKVLQSNTRLDLMVTDVGLPGGLNGRQLAEAGRQTRPDLKVLFITGYAENAVIGNGHLEPGMQIMTKPFVMDALAARIRAMIER